VTESPEGHARQRALGKLRDARECFAQPRRIESVMLRIAAKRGVDALATIHI